MHMHIYSTFADGTILNEDNSSLVKAVWERLNPDKWPLPVNHLPIGSALVGGAVRDGLLNRLDEKPDIDIVVPDHAIQLSNKLAKIIGATSVVLDAERDVARLACNGWSFDLARQIGGSLEEDLWRRDFRINAIAMTVEPNSKLIDPTGGIADLQQKRLVAVSEKNLVDDPLRCLRGLRLMAELDFFLDPQTRTFINTYSSLLPKSAPERIQSELNLIVGIQNADEVICLLREIGILDLWSNPSEAAIPSTLDAKAFTSSELSLALPLARLTFLLSDFGLVQLRFSRRICKQCQLLRKWKKLNDGKAYQTLIEADRLQLHQDLEDFLPALILDFSIKDQEAWLDRWRDSKDPLFHPASPVDGNILKETLGISEGPQLGALMKHLSHERAFDRLINLDQTFEEARDWLQHNSTSM